MYGADADRCSRRAFLLALGAGAAAAVALVAGCAGVPVLRARPEGGRWLLREEEFEELAAGGGVVLVRAPEAPDPLILARLEDGSFRALSALCTHQGCEVRPGGAFLQCPCHGSRFDMEGRVLRGPAAAPLARFPVIVEHGLIEIRTAEPWLGEP